MVQVGTSGRIYDINMRLFFCLFVFFLFHISFVFSFQQRILGLDLPLTRIPWEFFSWLFIMDSLIEIANGKVKPADIRKIFNLQILGTLDFKNISILLYVVDYVSKKKRNINLERVPICRCVYLFFILTKKYFGRLVCLQSWDSRVEVSRTELISWTPKFLMYSYLFITFISYAKKFPLKPNMVERW